MYIIDGIAYAGEQPKLISVIAVRPMADYKLLITFSNGEKRIFECLYLLDSPAFKPLNDIDIFNSVYVDFGTVVWNNGEIDIAPETLFENSIAVDERARA